MKNLKISKKLTVVFALVLILLVACIVVGIANLQNVKSQVETFYEGPYVVKGASNLVKSNFEAMQKAVFRSIGNEDQGITDEAIKNAGICAETIAAQIPIIEEHFLGDPQIVKNLQASLQELAPHRERVLELAAVNQNKEAAAYMEANNIPIIKKATVFLEQLISNADQKGDELIAAINAVQMQSVIILIIMGIASVLISVAFGVYITKGIVGPVNELESAAKNLSEGKLDSKISYESKDELGNLATSMRVTLERMEKIITDVGYCLGHMAEGNFQVKTKAEVSYVGDFRPILDAMRHINMNLSNTLAQINQASDQVASGSEQVSSGAQALSQGATEQASSVEELAATITEISGQVQQTAQNALDARNQTNEASDEVGECNRQMQEMLSAMNEISQSSSEIGKIIKNIEDIAFQTNILALNAAVEAARAGAAGKGFAVVADEVRNLASKSAEASKNTASLIESSIAAVERGTKIADGTAESLQRVVEGTKTVSATVDKIAGAAKEQANSVAQVTQGIDQISSVVQTNSATAEESAAASEELSGQAQMLKTLVGRFRLREDSATASPVSMTLPAASAIDSVALPVPAVHSDLSAY